MHFEVLCKYSQAHWIACPQNKNHVSEGLVTPPGNMSTCSGTNLARGRSEKVTTIHIINMIPMRPDLR